MKIIRYIQAGEIIQLGIEGKILFLKWGEMLSPMRLGKLKDIKAMSSLANVSLGKKSVKVPLIVKEMSKNITWKGIDMAEKYTDEEFYNDFLEDHKQMSEEGSIKLVGEFDEWL